MTIHSSAGALALLAACSCSSVWAEPPVWPLADPVAPPKEVLRDHVPVSGGYIRGVEVINSDEKSAQSPQDLLRLYVHLRKSLPGDLCVQVSTRDGRYSYIRQYHLPVAERETYALINLQSQYPQIYRHVSPRDLAVVARTGVCPADDGFLVPLFWNSPPVETSSRTLVITVQTGDRDATLYLGGKAAHGARVACAGISEDNVAEFDALCEQALTPDSHVPQLPIDIEACAFGECSIVQKARLVQ
jgi:hypothetical protein